MVAPAPGFSHAAFSPNAVPALTVANFTPYDDRNSIFGTDQLAVADNVTSARHIGKLVELVPTTNAFKWTGSIQAYRVPLKLSTTSVNDPTESNWTIPVPAIFGGESILQSGSIDQYTAPSNMGVFMASFNDQPDNRFSPLMENVVQLNATLPKLDVSSIIPNQPAPGTFMRFNFPLGFTTLTDHDTLVIKISGAADNTFVLKTWEAVEYTTLATSALYSFSRMSPPKDVAAMRAYREAVHSIPIAVSYYENANFFQRMFSFAKNALTGFNNPVARKLAGLNPITNALVNAVDALAPRSSTNSNGGRQAPRARPAKRRARRSRRSRR